MNSKPQEGVWLVKIARATNKTRQDRILVAARSCGLLWIFQKGDYYRTRDIKDSHHGMSYIVRAVSKTAGVSIRALHHYGAIGLLRPASTTEAGYRLYSE